VADQFKLQRFGDLRIAGVSGKVRARACVVVRGVSALEFPPRLPPARRRSA
jgi:hypothetical protein